jgi:hypothetical protein
MVDPKNNTFMTPNKLAILVLIGVLKVVSLSLRTNINYIA